ncbi:G-protein coupled receptor family C group 6 member A-like [Hemibagrus wyckioides]|uniref:G-protein coupled receptor family C group 6 member A-like n=1 Tax=Hemibagrus wyckioides TaxID=337641 RepID=UPI00266B7110|nr:G-protein coupled receptor family C group 6 member A-like [Hemibagrus wyckioides]
MLLWRNILLSCTVLSVAYFGHACDYEVYKCGAFAPGDVQIGMLSSCFSKVENLYSRGAPDIYNCSEFNPVSFVRMLAFIYTIETINNSSFLPGVRIGYRICDTCCHASKALQSTKRLLEFNYTEPGHCERNLNPKIKAIIGARYSEVSICVARYLSLYMVPQISASSSAEALSDQLRYPSFLRTIPSDIHQTKALAKLMSYFEWEWVGVVHGDDDYGKNALQGFLENAENENICTAFIEPLPTYLDFKDIDMLIQRVVQTIQNSTAKVVLVILREELVYKLFTEVIKQNISRTWIASDAWSTSQNISKMKGIDSIGDVFGFSFITGPIPGFKEYLQNLAITPGAENRFIEEYQKLGNEKDYLTKVVDITQAFADRLAVLSVAHSLRTLLKCTQTACPGNKDFPPFELLKELKQVNFTLDNQTFYFNASGNFVNGYHLLNWAQNKSSGQRDFVVVGGYQLEKEQINIHKNFQWYNSNLNTIPISICSNACPPGKIRKLLKPSCCHECIDCLEGTYSNDTNLQNCFPCQNGTWSLKGWTNCTAKTEVYWKWNGLQAIVFLVFDIAGFLLLFMNLIIYLVFRESPVIKQAGGYIYLLIMVGLALSYTSVIVFIGRPNVHQCRARQVLYGLGFSLSVSCILVKALRTFLAFLPRHRQHNVKKFYKPPVIIGFGTFLQVLICIFWLIFDSPSVDIQTRNDSMEITVQCNEGSGMGFGFMLCYTALLALICFILAFKGRKVPQRFNETGHIILSMLIFLFVWVCFTPIYVTKIQQRYSVQAAAILVSSYGIIFCHFAPKWYMALCKKKDEVTKEAYIAQARNYRTSNASILTTSSGVGSLASETGLHLSVSQTSMNMSIKSNNSAICSISSACILNTNKSSNSQEIRRRFRRMSI